MQRSIRIKITIKVTHADGFQDVTNVIQLTNVKYVLFTKSIIRQKIKLTLY